MFSCAVMLLSSVAPLGKVTTIVFFAVLWSEAGKLAQIKCCVHPVSRIAGRIGGRGSSSEKTGNSMCGERVANVGKVLMFFNLSALSVIATVPASQPRGILGPVQIFSDPPILLSLVALS